MRFATKRGPYPSLYMRRSDSALRAIEVMLFGLAKVDAPKIVVLVSGGIPTRFGDTDTGALSAAATAAARTRSTACIWTGAHSRAGRITVAAIADADGGPRVEPSWARGGRRLDTGHRVLVEAGDPSHAFQRIAREIAAYYLLSADSEPADRDGRTHKIKVSVARPGVDDPCAPRVRRARRRSGGQADDAGRTGRLRPAGAHGRDRPAAQSGDVQPAGAHGWKGTRPGGH